MRRVATCSVAMALTVMGLGGSAASRPAASRPAASRPAASRPAASRPAAGGPGAAARLAATISRGVKLVRFGGYTIDVPAAWPVYRLYRHPAQCVRYDRHAVYLGRPGPDQECPAHLVGRVATISLQARATRRAAPARQGPGGPGGMGLPQVGGVAAADAADHELQAVIPDPGLAITATYGTGDAGMLQVIRSVRRSAGPVPAFRPSAAAAPGPRRLLLTARSRPARSPARIASRSAGRAAGRSAGRAALRRGRHGRAALRRGRHGRAALRRGRHGFDACTAPSLAVMRAWYGRFTAAAIYLGGVELACDMGNLSAAWIRSATAMGWSLMPTYVGRQAPCSRFPVKINPNNAAAQGRAAANHAISRAAALGLRRGAPIYYDVESYNSARRRCRDATVTFLDSWTRQLHARGYVSGVYSSASSAAKDLGAARSVNGHGVARPDSLWFGLWDDRRNLAGAPYLLNSWWPGSHRIKQYLGPHFRRVHRITLEIDSDWVFGAVYRLARLGLADAPNSAPGRPQPADRQPDGVPHGTPHRAHGHHRQPLQAPWLRLPVE